MASPKQISYFSAFVIVGGILYILFLFYYIGSEIINVQSANAIIYQKQKEVEKKEVENTVE